MLFPVATIGDLSFRLLLIRPTVDQARGRTIEITHRFDTVIGEGRTTIEERRAGRAGLLLSQRCTIPLRGNAADDWRKGVAALGNDPVGIPLWIDALTPAQWSTRIYSGEYVVNFDPETGDFDIFAAADVPAEPDYPLLAPLLIGRWQERPSAQIAANTFGEVEIMLTEASPWECRIGINSYGSSWTALPDRKTPVREVNELGLELIQLGAAREAGLDRVNAAARWRQDGDFTFMSRLQIRQALTWFVAKKGAWQAWTPVPAWFQPGADTDATPDDYTARFASDTLSLTYLSGATARATIGFIQEIDTGERVQAVASETYLYTFTYQHDTGNPELFTNWDAPLVGAEGTFAPAQCSHREVLLSLKPQDVKADLDVVWTAGSLMADWIVGRLFGRVQLTIEKCDPSNVASTRAVIFDGFVRNVLPNGNTLKVTATLFGKMLNKRVPSDVFSPRCNAYVFDGRCGLLEADHDSAATLVPAGVSSDGCTLTLTSPAGWGDGGTGTFAANWFGPNGIMRTGTGRTRQVATIVSSEMDGAALVVRVNRPIFADLVAGGGQSVTLIPGCGGQFDADCGTKFDNQQNFRGFPFMPEYIEQSAPSMPKAKK